MSPQSRMNQKVFGFLALSLLASAWSGAGERVGNGGVSVVCRNAQGRIDSAQMLDLFEGENLYKLTYENLPGIDADKMIKLAELMMTGNQKFLLDFQSELPKVRAKIIYTEHGVGLTPTDDAFPKMYKKGCAFEQVANYTDDGAIYVDKEIFAHFDEVNKAALYVHETTYSVARTNVGDTSSVRSRKLTAQVLAKTPDAGVVNALMAQMVAQPAAVLDPDQQRHENAKKYMANPDLLVGGEYLEQGKETGVKVIRGGDKLVNVLWPNGEMAVFGNCSLTNFQGDRESEILDLTKGPYYLICNVIENTTRYKKLEMKHFNATTLSIIADRSDNNYLEFTYFKKWGRR